MFSSHLKIVALLLIGCAGFFGLNTAMAQTGSGPTVVLGTDNAGSAGTLTISKCTNGSPINIGDKNQIAKSQWVALQNIPEGDITCSLSDENQTVYSLKFTNTNGTVSNVTCSTLSGANKIGCTIQPGSSNTFLVEISKG